MTSRHPLQASPIWSEQQLDADRRQAITNFIAEWNARGTDQYRQLFAENVRIATDLFAVTHDLLDFETGEALATLPVRAGIARFLSGPPVSSDDLDTLAGSGTRIESQRRLRPDLAQEAARIIAAALDRERFPWLFESPRREPTEHERQTAIKWTAGLRTVQNIQTARRGESSVRQETKVESALQVLGFAQVARRPINSVRDLEPGTFCRESIVTGVKCDVPIALKDGRLLLIEAKVSNSAINSVKRLNRECGEKASQWNRSFGAQAIPAAVLAGVFKLKNLRDAQQNAGIVIFWEHNLEALTSFIEACI